jgi:hypothetical protein
MQERVRVQTLGKVLQEFISCFERRTKAVIILFQRLKERKVIDEKRGTSSEVQIKELSPSLFVRKVYGSQNRGYPPWSKEVSRLEAIKRRTRKVRTKKKLQKRIMKIRGSEKGDRG